MPLNVLQVKAAVKSGVSAVCATCTRWWEGQDRGLSKCTAASSCGGPIAGMDFPLYEGPIAAFERFCFVCASEAPFGIKLPERSRVIGICRSHIGMLDRYVAESPGAHFSLLSSKGIVVPVQGRYTPKTLLEVMVETEQMFEEMDKSNGS